MRRSVPSRAAKSGGGAITGGRTGTGGASSSGGQGSGGSSGGTIGGCGVGASKRHPFRRKFARGIVDGNQSGGRKLTTDGATLATSKYQAVFDAHAWYAKETAKVWPGKPLVWLLEGDFVQFVDSGRSSPPSCAEIEKSAADITCAIKTNMPNALVALNHSSRNTTGRAILVDTSGGGSAAGDSWSTVNGSGVNARIAEGAIAANITGTAPEGLSNNISKLANLNTIPACP